MNTLQLFEQIKSFHGLVAPITFIVVIISDLYGFLWIIGKLEHLNSKLLKTMHTIVFVGLGTLIVTGISMISLLPDFLSEIIFFIKMFFVVVLFWNAFRIGKEIEIPVTRKFKELTGPEKKKIFMVGITSLVSWVVALILANNL